MSIGWDELLSAHTNASPPAIGSKAAFVNPLSDVQFLFFIRQRHLPFTTAMEPVSEM
ncbi:MAG: hypothetical protein KatS3mg105_4344 [Gemmatales bacterium]|nr:MAG: hypothetical protein KatS3mg105_4344 [Gemmatales bacterium]